MKQLKYWSIFLGAATYLLLNIAIDALLLVEYSYTFGYSLAALIVDVISAVIILSLLFIFLFSPVDYEKFDIIIILLPLVDIAKNIIFTLLLQNIFKDRTPSLSIVKTLFPISLLFLVLITFSLYSVAIFIYENIPPLNIVKMSIANAFNCGDSIMLVGDDNSDNEENI